MNQDFEASYHALRGIYAEEAYSNIEINEAMEKFPNCSPGFVRYVIKGVLRNSMALDYKISKLSKNGLRGMKSKTKVILRLGIFALDEVDDMPDAVCVHEIVELAKHVNRPNSSFINAVLRSYLRMNKNISLPQGNDIKSLSVRYSCKEDLVQLILDQYGEEEGVRILDAFNQPIDVALRCNPMRQTREELLQKLNELGIEAVAAAETENGIYCKKGRIVDNDLFRSGAYSIQGISSQMAVEAVDPKPGERVLDVCAAPGGKSTAAAERMNNTGELDSWDIHEHRVELIRRNADRLQLSCIREEVMDSTVFYKDKVEQYDAVIADVPCSGIGTIPAKPEIKLRTDVRSYAELTEIQLQILRNAWKYAKPGGRVMYSTCTINKDENEGVIEAFLKEVPTARVVEKQRILPYNKNGFFFCVMRKSGE